MTTTCATVGRPDQATLEAAFAAAQKMKRLAEEVGGIFPEREDLIHQIVLALLMRENVLVYGTFGTGKSDLLATLFAQIIGATHFSISMSKFMTESHIIGLPNVKEMKESGKIHYDKEGGILEAHFLELDEMLDANGPALRTLLGILNEHQFKRGRQQENANLHTAIASTNESPENAVKKDGSLGAVLDRFIFHGEVDYLETPESRLKMYAKYLSGAKPSTTITYEEVQAASGIVTGPCQIDNPVILETYDKVLTRFRDTNPSISISDRRACKLMKCMEANAILNGRYEVQLDDIYAVGYGLCVAGNEKEFETFYQIAKEEIDAKKAEATDEVVMKLLESYEQQIPALGPNPTADELRAIMKSVHQLRSDCEAQVTADNPTARKKEAILDQLEQVQTTAMDIMVRG